MFSIFMLTENMPNVKLKTMESEINDQCDIFSQLNYFHKLATQLSYSQKKFELGSEPEKDDTQREISKEIEKPDLTSQLSDFALLASRVSKNNKTRKTSVVESEEKSDALPNVLLLVEQKVNCHIDDYKLF